MAERTGKKKQSKSRKADQSVLAGLSTTRPTRLGRERGTKSSGATKTTGSRGAAAARKQAAATKPRPRPAAPPPPESEERRTAPSSGPELVRDAVQAAGELAQIGLTVGARALRRAASRLPRP
jgi:hypothetical protein